MNITFRGDDVQGSGTKCGEILFSVKETPNGKILGSMYKTGLRDSEQFKSFALYNQDTVEKNEPASNTRLKNMAKKHLDQKTKDRNFDARNDRTGNGAPVRRKCDDRSKRQRQKTREL